jgi:hypothetical protein
MKRKVSLLADVAPLGNVNTSDCIVHHCGEVSASRALSTEGYLLEHWNVKFRPGFYPDSRLFGVISGQPF